MQTTNKTVTKVDFIVTERWLLEKTLTLTNIFHIPQQANWSSLNFKFAHTKRNIAQAERSVKEFLFQTQVVE